MEIPKLFVNMDGAIMGEDLIKGLRAFIPEKNIEERIPSVGVGKFIRISYPEFGKNIIMTLGVGNTAENTIYDHIAYLAVCVMVLPAENVTKADLQKSLNDTNVNMIIQCQTHIRDALENVLRQRAS